MEDTARHRSVRAVRLHASKTVRWLVVLAVLLVAARMALPSLLRDHVNRQLAKAPEYRGRLEEVDVKLWRGAYEIHGLTLSKVEGDVAVPLFQARRIDLSLGWRELFRGSLTGEIAMWEPSVRFVAGPTEAQTQTGEDVSWDEMLANLFPFRINRFEANDASVHFMDPHASPPVDLLVRDLRVVATNLSNTREVADALPAGITARGVTLGEGGLAVDILLDPLADPPDFELTAMVTNVSLVALNDFLRAYGNFDVERGEFAMFTSVASKDAAYDGYVKVFFEDLDVFEWRKERGKNALQVFWQAIVGTLTTVFKNQPEDRLATRIPVSGTHEDGQVGVGQAILSLLRNAFVRALVPKLDEAVRIEEVEIRPDGRENGESE